ncbi:MAG: transcription-repair coupling factor [Candidatus Aminicenantales bacterium]
MSLDFLVNLDSFQSLIDSIRNKEKGIGVTGLIEQAKPYFLSFLALEAGRQIVFIRPFSYPLSGFEEQCRFFLSTWSRSSSLKTLPALTDEPYQEIFPSLDSTASRMKFFYSLIHAAPQLILTNLPALLKPIPSPQNLRSLFLELEAGTNFERDRLLSLLDEYGYMREDLIASRGEYAWRGGIVDVFSPWETYPYRIEFRGDEIASLREFDPSTQRTLRRVESVLIPSTREYSGSREFMSEREELVPLTDLLEEPVYIIDSFEQVKEEWEATLDDLQRQYTEMSKKGNLCLSPDEIYPSSLWESIKRESVLIHELLPHPQEKTFSFPFQSVPRFENRIPFFLDFLKRLLSEGERCYIYLSGEGKREKLASLLAQHRIPYRKSSSFFESPTQEEVILLLGGLEQGFSFPREKVVFFSERDIFTEEKVIVSRHPVRPFISHFQDLKRGDYVVHTDYGIGIFNGLGRMQVDGSEHECIEILYRDDDRLYVPVEDLNLVQRYTRVGNYLPQLSKLGTPYWEKTKARTKKAIEKMTRELLQLYAQRKAVKGFRFSPEGAWQIEFERLFEYEETEDQVRSIKEVKRDMESEFPMDRLLCGDVGYGKTEVAMRASFKAIMDGKQVAVLCPTTVLASQHLKTFRNRMLLFPVRVEALTRLQRKSEQKRIVEDLKKGLVDIVIGTHRLLSEDVIFHDLGLLVIDEEQRFGVNHKEKIKKMKANIDVLTLTATPIPRTLNLSLAGLTDISLIETPPRDRLAVHTVVTQYNPKLIASAIKTELNRGGQVYFVHNRIEDIDLVASRIEKLVPWAKVVVVHGRMPGALLEQHMIDFINCRYNVLVSTTIIENGIDIPLVNTLIVNRADRFGLAQLYQLRGRVGRSSRQAFAYFLVPPFTELNREAKERLKALKEFSELGSGFRLAAKDLEIRGAGNLLGAQQHGYMEAVGFDYFIYLLEETIKEFKGEKAEEVKSRINLKVEVGIPEDYIPQTNLRLSLYKRISSVESLDEIEEIREEIEDRFGLLPSSTSKLLHYGTIKFLAQKKKIKTVDRIGERLVFTFFPSTQTEIERMRRLMEKRSGSITPQGVMSIPLNTRDEESILDETISILKEL